MNKIQLSHRMYSMHDLQRLIESKELIIQPKYQRRRTAWPLIAKTGLIDTIYANFPIPPIYIRNFLDDSRKRISEIVDGQQRISTINEFIDNEFKLSGNFSDPDLVGMKFNELPDDVQYQITEYEISCIAIKGANESDIISMFSRVNSFSLPLNDQEKRNAIYAGEFKSIVYELASQYHSFWRGFNVLPDSAIARMGDAQLVSEFFSCIIHGVWGLEKSKINKLYALYNEKFSNKEKYKKVFNQLMTYMGEIFQDEDIKTQFRKRSWFFPLLLILYAYCYGGIGKAYHIQRKKPKIENIKKSLLRFVEQYKVGSLNQKTKLLFQQGSKSPSKVGQRMTCLANVIRL